MSAARPAAEPDIENLLASIRKAIDHRAPENAANVARDSGGTVAQLPVPAARGGEKSRSEEILELRRRIAAYAPPASPPRLDPPPPPCEPPRTETRANGFAGVFTRPLQVPELRPVEEERPALRASYEPERGEETAEYGYDPPVEEAIEETDGHGLADPGAWQPRPPMAPAPPPSGRGLMSSESSVAANAAFARLADTLMARAMGEQSIEDTTRDLLRTMLQRWLDEHLPGIVERMVREEIDRVSRRGPYR